MNGYMGFKSPPVRKGQPALTLNDRLKSHDIEKTGDCWVTLIHTTMNFKDILTKRFPSIVIVEDACTKGYGDCFCVESTGRDKNGFPIISRSVGNSESFDSFLFNNDYFCEFVEENRVIICKE